MIFEVVPEEYHGLAQGTMSACSSIGIMINSWLIELIIKKDDANSYMNILILYFVGMCIALFFALCNLIKNYSTDGCHIYSRSHFDRLEELEKIKENGKTKENGTIIENGKHSSSGSKINYGIELNDGENKKLS